MAFLHLVRLNASVNAVIYKHSPNQLQLFCKQAVFSILIVILLYSAASAAVCDTATQPAVGGGFYSPNWYSAPPWIYSSRYYTWYDAASGYCCQRLIGCDGTVYDATIACMSFDYNPPLPGCSDCTTCPDGSQACSGAVCPAGSCTDGIQNYNETAVDYGGRCGTCSDEIQNGDETGIDIGGRCDTSTTSCSNNISNNILLSLNPAEIMPESETEISVIVCNMGNKVPNYPITLEAIAPQYQSGSCNDCGGHSHDTNRPIGDFLSSAGSSVGSSIQGSTNINGEFKIRYRASKFGGLETIRVWETEEPDIRDEKRLSIRIPELTLLPDKQIYVKIGGTNKHLGPPISITDNNHYGTARTVEAISSISVVYYDKGGENLLINDMSLPYGGGFDIYGAWDSDIDSPRCLQRGHCTHRVGRNADISGTGQGGKVTKERELEWAIKKVARDMQINIDYKYHRNHYHFTFGE
ncbi:MAG: hypothetical protein HZB79_00775 [Deltaproteobacteria bacterium]|nr:hypothetical protein [Deltaproteobacteria bacterium]